MSKKNKVQLLSNEKSSTFVKRKKFNFCQKKKVQLLFEKKFNICPKQRVRRINDLGEIRLSSDLIEVEQKFDPVTPRCGKRERPSNSSKWQ